MFSCRAAWQRCGAVVRRATVRLPRGGVHHRPMSSLPGGSGENLVYALLCGGAFVGSVTYTYIIVTRDNARYKARIAEIRAGTDEQWVPKPWPPKSRDEEEDGEGDAAAEAEGGEAEVGEEAAVAAEGDAAVEAVDQVVAEAAEVVAGVAKEVAEVAEEVAEAAEEGVVVAQEVEKVAEEVAQVAENFEEAVLSVTEPPSVTAEDPKNNGTTCSSEVEVAAS